MNAHTQPCTADRRGTAATDLALGAGHTGSAAPTPDSTRYLKPTRLLDFKAASIERLIDQRGWRALTQPAYIAAVYTFVRDEIGLGYNAADDLPASQVLAEGYGQCNTKSILLMALLRARGVKCRLHGGIVHKRLQEGIVRGLFYLLAPRDIIHSWVEVLVADRWVALEGVILDSKYIEGLRAFLPEGTTSIEGFAAGTEDIRNPPVDWTGGDTSIQMKSLTRDLGVFDDPDSFFAKHGRNLSGLRQIIYRGLVRHLMNRRVDAIRRRSLVAAALQGP